MASSASDNSSYPEFCSLAARDESVFSTFRQWPVYQEILEHFSYADGLNYLNQLRSVNPRLLDQLELFKTNDQYGGAEVMEFEGVGWISPSTLHYIRQLSYLEEYFGDLTGKHIVEVGIGYGGLAKLVMDRYDIASYTCFDLEPALALAARYLGKFGDRYLRKTIFYSLEKYPAGKKFDLFISNCAFTECYPEIQDQYLEKVIAYSAAGFMLYNPRVESYHPVILLSKLEQCGLKNLGSADAGIASNVFIVAWNTIIRLRKLPYRRRLLYKISPALYRFTLAVAQKIRKK